jgi:arylsulfatase A-like enzyme
MNRRNFITQAAAPLLAGSPPAQVRRERKNILLIYVEQFQHDVASFAGGPAATPNLEKLAGQAVNFRTACTTTALCSPARAALFTGRLGHRTSLEDNCYGWHSPVIGLDLKQTTIIEWTRKKGYFTGYFGKWHLGADGPIRRGVDRYTASGFERPRRPGKTEKPDFSLTKPYYEKGRTFAEKPGFYRTVPGDYESTHTAQVARAGAGFLEEAGKSDRPFFLGLSFLAVHPPYDVPKPYSEMYDWQRVELPGNVHDRFERKPAYQADVMWPFHDTGHMSDDDWRRSIAFYRGFVTMLDQGLGQVLDALKANGLAENTLVVVLADHGDMNGAHNRYDKGPYAYDEVMRIPLLVRWPGAAARQITRHVHSMDLNQTIVEWAGLEPDAANVDSRSLRPLIEHGDSGWVTPDEAFHRYEWYNGLWFGIRAIRTPEFKYCFNPGGADELYDLRKDPGELVNLIDTPGVRSVQGGLEDRLLAYLEKTADHLVAPRLRDHLTAMRASVPAGTKGRL